MPRQEHRRGAHLLYVGHWARRWTNLLSPWRMTSVTPVLRLLSQPQSITALWPVPNYTAWWTEAHVCEQLVQDCYLTVPRLGVDPGTFRSPVRPVTVIPPSYTTKISTLQFYFSCCTMLPFMANEDVWKLKNTYTHKKFVGTLWI